MLKPTHIATSLGVTLLLIDLNPQAQTMDYAAPLLTGVYFGAQLPDIDRPHTALNEAFGPLGTVLGRLEHRGATHSLLAWGLTVLLAIYANHLTTNSPLHWVSIATIGLSFGYLLHLIEDDFSHQGVLWCWPLSHYILSKKGWPYKKRKWRWYYYRTGGRAEAIIYPIVLLIDAGLIYWWYQQINH